MNGFYIGLIIFAVVGMLVVIIVGAVLGVKKNTSDLTDESTTDNVSTTDMPTASTAPTESVSPSESPTLNQVINSLENKSVNMDLNFLKGPYTTMDPFFVEIEQQRRNENNNFIAHQNKQRAI